APHRAARAVALVLANARIVHGDPAVPPRRADILVRGDRIAGIGDRRAWDAAGATVIDLDGRTVLPGLIDLHVHLEYTGEPRSDEIAAADSPQRLIARMIGLAQRHLRNGVTTVRDLGSHEPNIFV